MEKLIERFRGLVNGCITGFDRIVFKGFILPLMAAKGAVNFYRINNNELVKSHVSDGLEKSSRSRRANPEE